MISGFHTSAFLGNNYNLVAWTFYGNKNEPSTHCVKYVHNKQIWLYFQIPMHLLFMCLFTYISLSWLEYEKHQFHGSLQFSVKKFKTVIWKSCASRSRLELVSKELNHFGVIAVLFRQIGGHSRFVLFCSFWRLFTIKMIKSVKVFPFSFWEMITIFFFYFIKFKPPA